MVIACAMRMHVWDKEIGKATSCFLRFSRVGFAGGASICLEREAFRTAYGKRFAIHFASKL